METTATTIKERPILFSGEMVRAILAGRKTQTRRLVKPQPPVDIDELHGFSLRKRAPYRVEDNETGCILGMGFQDDDDRYYIAKANVGDRLWVRETWVPLDRDHNVGDSKYAYRADMTRDSEDIRQEYLAAGRDYRWRPSIHMPRCASRITLEVTGMRVERVHDITEENARAEGVESCEFFGKAKSGHPLAPCKTAFAWLWKTISGPESRDANPWVWVIEFKREERG